MGPEFKSGLRHIHENKANIKLFLYNDIWSSYSLKFAKKSSRTQGEDKMGKKLIPKCF